MAVQPGSDGGLLFLLLGGQIGMSEKVKTGNQPAMFAKTKPTGNLSLANCLISVLLLAMFVCPLGRSTTNQRVQIGNKWIYLS